MATEFINGQWRIPNSWNVDESNQDKISNYSMKFNGTDTSVNVGLIKPFNNAVSNFAVSYWIKANFSDSQIHFDFRYNGATRGVAMENGSGTQLTFYVSGGAGTIWQTPVSGLNSNEWNHIVLNFDGSIAEAADKAEFWINGVKKTNTVTSPGNSSTIAISGDGFLGNGFNTYKLEGQLDQFCTFDYTLSSSQIAILYGNSAAGYFQIGNPMALTPNPVAFYPLGDQDLIGAGYNGANWLVPNQVAAGGDVFQSVPLRTTNSVPTDTITSNINYTGTPGLPDPFTVSFWMKDSVVGNGSVFFDHDASTYTTTTPKGAFVYFTGGKVLIYLAAAYWRFYSLPSGVALTDNEWRNIVVYINPLNNGLGKVWIDGTPLALSNSNPSTSANNFTAGFRFYLNNFGSNVMYFKDYEIDNAGATLLYNNGAPLLDTSTLAQAPDHWWKLNASDTFDIATSTWTIKDHVGSQDGTSVNMDASNLTPSELPNTGGRQGYSPYAINLDGTSQTFIVDNSSKDLNVDYLTVSAWFYPDALQSFKTIIGNRYFNNGFMSWAVQLKVDGTIRYLQKTPYVGTTFFSTDTYNAGEWNHVAVTYDGTSAKIYLNGGTPAVRVLSGVAGPIQYQSGFISDNVTIGAAPASGSTASPGGPSQFIDGQLSNVSLYNTALTASQVATIYNNGIPGDISSLNPLAWWELGSMMGFNGVDTYTALSNTDSNFAAISSANMAGDDVVNGPGYSDGGSGTSSLVIEKQAPYSFNNALSESMAISNRDDSQITDPYPLTLQLDLSDETGSYIYLGALVSTSAVYPYTVDWGDGNVETISSASQLTSNRLTHTYNADEYPKPVVQIGRSSDVGGIRQFEIANGGSDLKLVDVKQFGKNTLDRFNIYGASSCIVTATDNLIITTSLRDAFRSTRANPVSINSWDVSTVTDVQYLASGNNFFNQDLNNWDTSSINSTLRMFFYSAGFNGNMSNWYRPATVTTLFHLAGDFNQDISTKYISAANSPSGSEYIAWDMDGVTNMSSMLYQANDFNQDVSNWNTSSVTNMKDLFRSGSLNQDLSTNQVTIGAGTSLEKTYTAWDVKNVTTFNLTFEGCYQLNQTFYDWELSANLTTMSRMFRHCGSMSAANYANNWGIFANSVKDDNSGSGGAISGRPKDVNAQHQGLGTPALSVGHTCPVSSGGVQHFTTVGRAMSYLTSDAQITFAEEEGAVQLYTANFLQTPGSDFPTQLVGVTSSVFTFEWSGSVWEFKKSGTTLDTDTGGATLQEGPEDGTWNILTVVTANQNWNYGRLTDSGNTYTT